MMNVPEWVHKTLEEIISEVEKVIIGKRNLIEILIIALISGGHVLIEGLPGTAKTTTAKAFAKTIGGIFKRIQFTSDTLPADITGFYIYTIAGRRELKRGPIFTNILLADELNRAPPRTQSALLEAMQERQVTIEGDTYELPRPFMVIATQLPYGYAGTYPLTELQADRFMFRVWSGYMDPNKESEVISKIDYIDELPVKTVTKLDDIIRISEHIKRIHISKEIIIYITELVDYIRKHPDVAIGPSVRGEIALYKGARALAVLKRRDFVIPDDIKLLAHYALDHRIRVKPKAEVEGINSRDIIEKALEEVEVPK